MPANVWPVFDLTQRPRTVKRILLELGGGVAERTDGLIRFDVNTVPGGQGGLVHNCYLVVQRLAYRYPFMKVMQGREQYPVTVVADNFPQEVTVRNEAEYIDTLERVFQSEDTKNTVLQLLDAVSE